jgi:biopolymer transport protein TolR
MPAFVSRGTRGRRALNEINMVPFIDVMLVLLIIFMVTAPLITTGVVDLPSVGKSQQRPPAVIEIVVGSDERLRIKVNGAAEPVAVPLAQLAARVRSSQLAADSAAAAEVPVVISADRQIKYDAVMKVMATLQKERVKRVALAVKQGE